MARFDYKNHLTFSFFMLLLNRLYYLTFILGDLFISSNATWNTSGVTIAGNFCYTSEELNQISSAYTFYLDDDGTLFISNINSHVVLAWTEGAGSGRIAAGNHKYGNETDQLYKPWAVVVDQMTDSIIICDSGNYRVMRWPRQNAAKGEIMFENIECAGLAIDNEHFLYVGDVSKSDVKKYRYGDKQGTVVAGGHGHGDALNQLMDPAYIYVDQEHTLYISDPPNHRVVKWIKGADQGIIVIGGMNTETVLPIVYGPAGLFVDSFGTVYVVDSSYNQVMRLRKGAEEGRIIAGSKYVYGNEDNQLKRPHDISFDQHGNLYILDSGNCRVQRLSIEQH